MYQSTTNPKNYKQLSLIERETIALRMALGLTPSCIAIELQRNRSTITRELHRNAAPTNECEYRSVAADIRAISRRIEAHKKIHINNQFIRRYIEKNLCLDWSPEQIAGRLQKEHKGCKTNYESIYQYIYKERPDLIKNLRNSHKKRKKRGTAAKKHANKIPNRVPIESRPPSANDRSVYGHFETDTAVSRKSNAALQVIIERKSRYVMLSGLPSKTAENMSNTLCDRLALLPSELRLSITYDNGSENANHQKTNMVLGTASYFCTPYHSWEKGSVENCIGLVRQYLPKKTDFGILSVSEIKRIEDRLNDRPRKCLGFNTPRELFGVVALTH